MGGNAKGQGGLITDSEDEGGEESIRLAILYAAAPRAGLLLLYPSQPLFGVCSVAAAEQQELACVGGWG